jgi:hypothetical protein
MAGRIERGRVEVALHWTGGRVDRLYHLQLACEELGIRCHELLDAAQRIRRDGHSVASQATIVEFESRCSNRKDKEP